MTERINISSGVKWEGIVGYSRAVRIGNIVEITGTVAVDENGNLQGGSDAYLQAKYGKSLEEFFPDDDYQLMHVDLFPDDIIHAENLGGEIDKVLNKRLIIGCYPWRFVGGESSICRIVAYDEKE